MNKNFTRQLFRTDLSLTGNYSLYVNHNQIKIDSLIDTKHSAKLSSIQKNQDFVSDVSDYFEKFRNNPELAFYHPEVDYAHMSQNYDEQYDTREWSGWKYRPGSKSGFFAPLWLSSNQMPTNFVVYRIPTSSNLIDRSINFRNPNQLFQQNIIQNSELVKTFDLTSSSTLGRYLRQHKNSNLFTDHPLELVNKETPYLSFSGISLQSQNFIRYNSTSDLLSRQRTLRDFNQKIKSIWKQEGIISNNLINLTFQIENQGDEEFYRYYGFYVNQQQSNIELQADPYQFFYYTQRQVFKKYDRSPKRLGILESPRYFRNDDKYLDNSTIDHITEPLTNNYLGYLKFSDNSYTNYTTENTDKCVNLVHENKTNLTSKKFATVNNGILLDNLFNTLEVKFNQNNSTIYSPKGGFKSEFEDCYISIPNQNASSNYIHQPKIKRVINRHTAIIDPAPKGLLKTYQNAYTIKISKPFVHGYFNPIPYYDLNLSMLRFEDANFEIDYPDTSLELTNFEDYITGNNLYDIKKEQDLLGTYPLQKNTIKWRANDGTNARNNFGVLNNSPQSGNYHFAHSSVLLSNDVSDDNSRSNVKRHSHDWVYLRNTPTGDFNIKIRLGNFRIERGKLLKVHDPENPDHEINNVTLMETGEEFDEQQRSTLLRMPDDTELSITDIVSYLDLNPSTMIGKYEIYSGTSIERVGYTERQQQLSHSYLSTISKITGFDYIDSIDYFEDTTVNYFQELFKDNEYYFNSKFTEFKYGSQFSNSYCWYKGFRVNIFPRISGTGNTEDSLVNARSDFQLSDHYNDYQFASCIVQDETVDEYKINVICNEQWNYVILILSLPTVPSSLEDFYQNYRKYSFSWIKQQLGKYQEATNNISRDDLKVSMYTITGSGNKIYDNFYLQFIESRYFKVSSDFKIKKYPEEKWYPQIKNNITQRHQMIGTYREDVEREKFYISIPNNLFLPDMYPVLFFQDKNDKQPLKFDFQNSNFGIIKDIQFKKVGNYKNHLLLAQPSPEGNVLLAGRYQGDTFEYKQSEYNQIKNIDILDFPRIGEVGYEFKDVNIFVPQWSFNFYHQFNKRSNSERIQHPSNLPVPGYINSHEERIGMNSKVLDLPGEFELPSPNIPLLLESLDEGFNLIGIYDVNQHFKNIFLERFLNNDTFQDVTESTIINKFGSLENYIEQYIENNLLGLYKLDSIRLFQYDTTEDGFIIQHPNFLPSMTDYNITPGTYDSSINNNALQPTDWPYEKQEVGNNVFRIVINWRTMQNILSNEILSQARSNELPDLNFALLPKISLRNK